MGYDAAEIAAFKKGDAAKEKSRVHGSSSGSGSGTRGKQRAGSNRGGGRKSSDRAAAEGMFDEIGEDDEEEGVGQPKKYKQARVSFGNAGPSSGPTLSRSAGAGASASASGGAVRVIEASGTTLQTQTKGTDRDYL